MRKIIISVLIALCLILGAAPAFAEPGLGYFTDTAGLENESGAVQLEDRA